MPIELLISIIVLSFVMVIAGVSISRSQCETSELNLIRNVRSFASAIQQVHASGPGTRTTVPVDFSTGGCDATAGLTIKIAKTVDSSPVLCGACSGRTDCYYIEASRMEIREDTGEEVKYTFMRQCVDMPTTTPVYVLNITRADVSDCQISPDLVPSSELSFTSGYHGILIQKGDLGQVIICDLV